MAGYGVIKPYVPPGWADWTFWQYDDGKKTFLPGHVPVDGDLYNGDDLTSLCVEFSPTG
jgi:hypothetical protein